MDPRPVVLLTDHESAEGSRAVLVTAVERLTGSAPTLVDARHFLTGGGGRVTTVDGLLRLEVPAENLVVSPSMVIVYEVQPPERRGLEDFQAALRRAGTVSLGTETGGWRAATEKNLTVEQFRRDGIPQMETISLTRPTPEAAAEVFARLGSDVWARPAVGTSGNDVFHVTTGDQLRAATTYYAESDQDWLMARDAGNVNADGLRHQFRVVVLEGRVVRACEHVQADADSPCNEAQGAVSTVLDLDDLAPELAQLAIDATKSLGLSFGGVDLALENGGVVFEVNVHPVLSSVDGLETAAMPYVEAHLARLRYETDRGAHLGS